MASTPYYGPYESAEDIFIERTFVAGDFIAGVGYGQDLAHIFFYVISQHFFTSGIQVVLYISCALFLWNARRSRGRQSTILLGYITMLFSVETIFVGVQARTVQLMYIDNRNFPGGPWAYFLATQNLAVNVMFYATLFVLTFLSDLLVVCSVHVKVCGIFMNISSSSGDVGLSGVAQEHLLDTVSSPSLH